MSKQSLKTVCRAVHKGFKALRQNRSLRKIIHKTMRLIIIALLYAYIDVGVIERLDRIVRITEVWF